MPYFKNVLVAVDQLGNALCGGNPDNTISARVGYFSEVNRTVSKYFWQGLAKIINFTFWPVDGPDHCKQAFEADPEEAFSDNNSDFFRVLISIIIIASCIPISLVLYTLYPFWKLFGI
jgi:hypothetical protein